MLSGTHRKFRTSTVLLKIIFFNFHIQSKLIVTLKSFYMNKTLTAVFFVTLLSTILILPGCKKENQATTVENNQSPLAAREKKFHIFFAEWDEWGRSSRNCAGWGLCNYRDCWFCCTDERDNIVSCNDNVRIVNSGKALIDSDTNEGFLYIKLDPDVAEQADAITDQLILYIDDDIVGENFTARKGEYLFNSEIGSFGGYMIPVVKR